MNGGKKQLAFFNVSKNTNESFGLFLDIVSIGHSEKKKKWKANNIQEFRLLLLEKVFFVFWFCCCISISFKNEKKKPATSRKILQQHKKKMSFLPTFTSWDAIELVGSGGYGRVFRCNRKKSAHKPPDETPDTKAGSENSLSANWSPVIVAIKMIPYFRESSTAGNANARQQQQQPEIPLLQPMGGGAGVELIGAGLEGLKEAAALQTAGPHPALIRLHSCFYSLKYKSLCIVEEWADGPTLGDIYMNCGYLTEQMMTPIALDLLHGLLQLHSCRIIHRDMKPTNVLTTRSGISKIVDLGVSALRPEIGDYRRTYVGTAGFMAPEVVARGQMFMMGNVAAEANGRWGPMSARAATCGPGEGYNEAADVWSLGVTLLEGAMGQIPAHEYVMKVMRCFSVEGEAEARRLVQLGKPAPPYDDAFVGLRRNCETRLLNSFHCSPQFADLLLSMLDPIPARRPSCLQLITKHPFCVRALEQMAGHAVAATSPLATTTTTTATAPATTNSNANQTQQQAADAQSSSASSPSTAAVSQSGATSSALAMNSSAFASGAGSSDALSSSVSQAGAANDEGQPATATTAGTSSAATTTALTLAYLSNFSTNKSFRTELVKAIARIPQPKRPERNLLNPNSMLPPSTAANDDGDGTDLGAAKNELYTNAFRNPKGGNWVLPSSKFIDVLCGLDFPTSSSASKFAIGHDPVQTNFAPVSTATDGSVLLCGKATNEDFMKAAKRVEAIAPGAVPTTMPPASLPFGPLFQKVILPSLDSATLRSSRLDTWLDDAGLASVANAQNEMEQSFSAAGAENGGEENTVACFDNLRRILSECEASVPNFSESFLASVTDVSTVDPAACALVTHAFDRGQCVTRHRDGLIHGMAIRLPQNPSQGLQGGGGAMSSAGLSSQQQQGPSGGGNSSVMPLTGRRSRMGTPRVGMVSSASLAALDALVGLPANAVGGGGAAAAGGAGGMSGGIGTARGETTGNSNVNAMQQQQQGQLQQQGNASGGNIFLPLPQCSAFMTANVPTRATEKSTLKASTNTQTQLHQHASANSAFGMIQPPPSHEAWNIAMPASLHASINSVSEMMNSYTNMNNNNGVMQSVIGGGSAPPTITTNGLLILGATQDGNDYSLRFRDEWLSSENSSQQQQQQLQKSTLAHNDHEQVEQDTLVANGINEAGLVYAADKLFGFEAKAYHAKLAASMLGMVSL